MLAGYHTLHHSPMFGGEGVPAETVARAAAEAGFETLGVDLGSAPDPSTWRSLAGVIAGEGLGCSDVVGLVPDPDRDAAPEARRLLELAGALGAPYVVAYVPRSMSWSLLVERVGEAAEVLAGGGVRLAVEAIPHSAVTTLAEAARLCEAVGWARAGLVVDAVHLHLAGGGLGEVAALDAERVCLVQLADVADLRVADLAQTSRHHRLLPGEGVLPLTGWHETLERLGYRGAVVGEVLSDELRALGPVVAAARVRTALDHLGFTGSG